jgi:hypothetical protein
MKKVFIPVFFCTSFFSYASENNNLPGVTRTKSLGDTGAEAISPSLLNMPTKVLPAIERGRSLSNPFNQNFIREENPISPRGGKGSPRLPGSRGTSANHSPRS